MTQREVAIRCGKTERSIILLENGEIKNPSFSSLLSYLRAVGKPLGRLGLTPHFVNASDLEALGFKEGMKPLLEKKELPKETKKKVLKYAEGIRFFTPG